ncbi:unnamed protein product [Bemisia tabaci]|uniref:Major facilitator superfamily (MFS) profile domain-containing protein n=1 Tax=Bemisia tabaci TaxID=7038 RepID=A0A9P0CF96_BEMTA|nr:unnamed protein product [Bemisia tabaci]
MKLLPQNGTLHQILASIAAALAGFNSGMWRVWPSLAIPHLKSSSSPFQASDTELSLIASLSYFSYFLSPFLCRYLIRFGRKFCVVVSLLLFGVTWSAALVASNPYVLYGASIAAGFGNGLSSIIVPIYISEIASPSIRGALVTGYSLTFTSGQIFTAAAGIELRYHSLNLAGLAFSVFSFVLATVFVRETPQHHLIVGDDAAAKETHRYFHSNASSSLEAKDGADQDLEEMKKKILAEMSSQSSFSELFQTRGSRRAVLIICLVSCFQMLAGISSIVSFSSITLPPTHSYLTVDLTVLLCLVLGVTSNSIGSYLIDLVGRRILLAVSSFLGSVITLALAVFYFLYDKDTPPATSSTSPTLSPWPTSSSSTSAWASSAPSSSASSSRPTSRSTLP